MLRFQLASSVDEFEIVKEVKKSKLNKLKRTRCRPKKVLPCKIKDPAAHPQPVWTDDDDDGRSNTHLRPPQYLDVLKVDVKENQSGGSDSDLETVVQRKSVIAKEGSHSLPSVKELNIRRVRDGNHERRSVGPVVSVDFNRRYKILLTSSLDSTMAFFKVDGVENALLRDRVFEKYPISSAKFTSDGDKVVFTSNKGTFRVYDLETGAETRARNFIGSPPNEVVNQCAVSVHHPKLVALGTNSNAVYLADLRSLEKVVTVRASGVVNSICFVQDGTFLNTYGDDGVVFVFDIRNSKSRIVHHWTDHASLKGLSIASSTDNHWLACGSESGFVNLYDWPSTMSSDRPSPNRSIPNLLTAADMLCFHPSNEMLCLASSKRTMAVRLFHLDAGYVFENFPVRVGRLDNPTSIAFSPGGKFLCVGQSKGQVAMYTISHYPNY